MPGRRGLYADRGRSKSLLQYQPSRGGQCRVRGGHIFENRGGGVRKLLLLLAVTASAVAVTVSPAGAVTGNFQPDNVHNYVGLVAFYDAQGNFLWRCTGSLLNSTTFLTAGHCTDTSS